MEATDTSKANSKKPNVDISEMDAIKQEPAMPSKTKTKKTAHQNKKENNKNTVNEKKQSINTSDVKSEEQQSNTITVGSMIGEIVWLMSQSPLHRYLSLADLEWLLMPPIILGQYKIFRDSNKKPVGAALWGCLNEEAEKRLKSAGRLAPQDWGNNAQLDQDQGLVATEGGTLWLVELVTPFHTKENKHREQMLADLMSTAFKDKEVKMMHINPETSRREEIVIDKSNKNE